MGNDGFESDSQVPWLNDGEYRRCLELALDELDMGVVVSRDGQIVFINEAHERIMGYSIDELRAVRSTSLVSEEDRESTERRLEQRRAGNSGPSSFHTNAMHRNGRLVDLHVASAALPGPGPNMLTIIRDITEERAAEERSRRAHRMEAIGHLASGVAHDFNNYLTSVRLIAESVAGAKAEERAALLQELDRLTTAAARLTAQLGAFGGEERNPAVVIDINIIVFEMTAMLERLLGPGVELIVKLEPGLPPVQVDPGQLQQVIVNLVVNAGQAMEKAGRVTVQTSLQAEHVCLDVADTGVGMRPEVVEHAFEPFYTLTPGERSGMGLSIVYGIVRARHGTVEVQSAAGEGTTVAVRFPAADAAELTPRSATDASTTTVDAVGTSVLIIEDGRSVGHLIESGLNRAGFDAVRVDVETALQDTDGRDALVIDVRETDGSQVAALRRLHPKARFVFLCAPPALSDADWKSGRCVTVPKPFAIAELAAAILCRQD